MGTTETLNETLDQFTANLFDGSTIGDDSTIINENMQKVSSVGNGMSFISNGSNLVKSVGSKSGITVLDLRTKSSSQSGNDISKSVPIFGSDVTSSEPSMGDWEIYLSKGRI